MKFKNKLKIITIVLIGVVILNTQTVSALSYNYNDYGIRESAEGYTVSNVISNIEGEESFYLLEEVKVTDEFVYILDSGTSSTNRTGSRLFIFDLSMNHIDTITSYVKSGNVYTFNGATGFSVKNNKIYIADTYNEKVVILDLDGNYISEIVEPDDVTFDSIAFQPTKVDADSSGRVYVIAKNAYEGILQFGSNGEFELYTGVNYVSVSFIEALLRKFYTEEQLAQVQLYLPSEFTNLCIDDKNFIYTTTRATSETSTADNLIKKINPSGNDVLISNGYVPVNGDSIYLSTSSELTAITGPSEFVSLTTNSYGLYSAVDSTRGRIFTYNSEGDLLYVSGELGTQADALSSPSSIHYLGNDLLVLDKSNKNIKVFQETHIGKLINEGSELQRNGYFEEAVVKWLEVLELNTNYQKAYSHVGKLILNDDTNEVMKVIDESFDVENAKDRYKLAMEYFEKANDVTYYSQAFRLYRSAVLTENFDWIMTTVVIGFVAGTSTVLYLKYKKRKG